MRYIGLFLVTGLVTTGCTPCYYTHKHSHPRNQQELVAEMGRALNNSGIAIYSPATNELYTIY